MAGLPGIFILPTHVYLHCPARVGRTEMVLTLSELSRPTRLILTVFPLCVSMVTVPDGFVCSQVRVLVMLTSRGCETEQVSERVL